MQHYCQHKKGDLTCGKPALYIDFKSGSPVCYEHRPRPIAICRRCGASFITHSPGETCPYCPLETAITGA